jgi:hypothetical protein
MRKHFLLALAGASVSLAFVAQEPWPIFERCMYDRRPCTTEFDVCDLPGGNNCFRCDGTDEEDVCDGIPITEPCYLQEDLTDDCGFFEYATCDGGKCVNWHYGNTKQQCRRITCIQ